VDSRKGWWVVFGCVVTLTITTGVGFFSTAVLAEDILLQTGWSELDYSKAVTFWGISAALIRPLSGALIDRFGPRRMMVLGICIASAAEFMAGQVDVLWQFYAVMVMAPIGLMCCTYIPVATVVTHWFDKQIGGATGLAMLGLGLDGGIFTIIARNLVTNVGYQTSFTWLAGTLLLAIVPTLLFIRSPRPGELDQGDVEADADSESSKEPTSDLTLIESVRTRSFWALSMGDMLTGMVFMVLNTLLVLYLTKDTGDGDFATGVFSVLSFGLGFGILVFGPLGDLFNFNRVMSIC